VDRCKAPSLRGSSPPSIHNVRAQKLNSTHNRPLMPESDAPSKEAKPPRRIVPPPSFLPPQPTLTNSHSASLKHTSPQTYTPRSLEHHTVPGTVCSSPVGDPMRLLFSHSPSSSRNDTLTAHRRSSPGPTPGTHRSIIGCSSRGVGRRVGRSRAAWGSLSKATLIMKQLL